MLSMEKSDLCTDLHSLMRVIKKYAESKSFYLTAMSAIGQQTIGMPIAPVPGTGVLHGCKGGADAEVSWERL